MAGNRQVVRDLGGGDHHRRLDRAAPGQQAEAAVAALDARGEIADDRPATVALADAGGLDHQLARQPGILHRQRHIAGRPVLPCPLPCAAEVAEPLQPADIPLPPGGDAVAQPVLLLGNSAVELVPVALFLVEERVAPGLERGEAGLEAPRLAAVEPDGRVRQVLEEAPVVADEHDRRAQRLEALLEPLDRGDVEMVGRLVEEEDVRLRRQCAGERGAAAFAAGKPRRILLAGETEGFEEVAAAMGIVARRQSRFDECAGGGEAREVGLLRQVAHRHRRLDEAAAGIGLDQPGGDLEERRLARAVPPDQAEPLAGADREPGAGQERRAAEGEADVLEEEEGRRRHGLRRRSPHWVTAWR